MPALLLRKPGGSRFRSLDTLRGAALSTAYTATITDSEGMADSRSQVAVYARPQNDGAGLVDSRFQEFGSPSTKFDNEGLLDSIARLAAHLRPRTDADGLTDAVSYTQTTPHQPVFRLRAAGGSGLRGLDTLRGGVVTGSIIVRSAADPAGLVDSITLRLNHDPVAEPLSLADSVSYSKFVVIVRTITDPEGISDPRSQGAAFRATVLDEEGITEQLAYEVGHTPTHFAFILTDPEGLTDAQARPGALSRLLSDTEGLLDGTALDAFHEVLDPLGLSDAVLLLIERDLVYRFGQPQPKWSFGPPIEKWHTDPPIE